MRHVYVVVHCDHPKCPHSVTAPTQGAAAALARRAGWLVATVNTPRAGDYCAEHKPAPKETHDDQHRP